MSNTEWTREQFMKMFRSNDFHDKITADDAHEIFLGCLHGSSDVTKGLIDELCSEYSAGDVMNDNKPINVSSSKAVIHRDDTNYAVVLESENEVVYNYSNELESRDDPVWRAFDACFGSTYNKIQSINWFDSPMNGTWDGEIVYKYELYFQKMEGREFFRICKITKI